DALRLLREWEAANLPPITRSYVASLRAVLVGDRDEALRATEEATRLFRDPEGRYYLARHFGYLGDVERALAALREAVDHGFLPRTLGGDAWLRTLRGQERFEALVREVESRRDRSASVFTEHGGRELLGASA